MRQEIVCEKDEQAQLKKGHTLFISVRGESIGIRFDRSRATTRKGMNIPTEETLKCPKCPRKFRTPSGRGSHMKSAHGIASQRQTVKKKAD